ncbi:MAG: sigma 54-interacting transcriptional regulator, partial [Planctomycetota bacterium]
MIHAQMDNISFTRLSRAQGLSQVTVRCFLQDKYGFVWIGTDDGLNRFDGYSFIVYKNDPVNPRSVTDNKIRALYEDVNGVLWIGTDGGGLNRYDRDTDDFSHYYHNPDRPLSLSQNAVMSLWGDDEGQLWIGTFGGGISKLDPETDTFTRYQNETNNARSLSDNRVLSIWGDKSGAIWAGTYLGGLNKMVHGSDQFIHYQHIVGDETSIAGSIVLSILEDRSGVLWFGTEAGLNKYDRETDGFIHYKHDPDDIHSLSDNTVWSLFEDQRGQIWVGTSSGGLNRFNRVTERFTAFVHDERDNTSLSSNGIFSIYEDRSGVLWLGTQEDGINTINLNRQNFRHIRAGRNGFVDDDVRSICVDRFDDLWVGTFEGGLYRLDRKRNTVNRYFKNDETEIRNLGADRANAILEDNNGIIWVGTSDGLSRYNRRRDRFESVYLSAMTGSTESTGSGANLPRRHITTLLEDRNNHLWVGTMTGLARLDSTRGLVTGYSHDESDTTSISGDVITSLFEDASGQLWVGTESNGFCRYDIQNDCFQHFTHDREDPASLGDNRVLSIYEDGRQRLWIGTWRGLNMLEENGDIRFLHFSEKDGLPDATIQGILEDADGKLWLSTNNGLSRFDPESKSFKNYDMEDGLQGLAFNTNAVFKNNHGELFFGGINGLNIFNPIDVRDNMYIPPVVITSLTQNGETIKTDTALEDVKEIILSWPNNRFEFEFASLNYTLSNNNQHAYYLEGFDKGWNYIGERHAGRYTNLPGGRYTLHLKGSNNDGIWNETGINMNVIVVPPLWRKAWFQSGIILGVFILGWVLYRRRMHYIKQNRRQLEMRVKEKAEAAKALQGALSEVERLKNRLEAENVYLRDEIKVQHNFANIVTGNRVLKNILRNVEQVAATDATVLVLGESGTGKELIARAVHNVSARSDRPLVKVDCSTLPANLIESELFGHEKGAFTGATARKTGRFELANKGTIFLDEIGDLPLELQTKLLRVLQDGEFEVLGNPKTVHVDVRVIAATNRDLEVEIDRGNFREDLFYRLNVFPIKVPPLRSRKDDIPLLVNHFVNKYA